MTDADTAIDLEVTRDLDTAIDLEANHYEENATKSFVRILMGNQLLKNSF